MKIIAIMIVSEHAAKIEFRAKAGSSLDILRVTPGVVDIREEGHLIAQVPNSWAILPEWLGDDPK